MKTAVAATERTVKSVCGMCWLTARDLRVLENLWEAGEALISGKGWVTPMYLGGSDGSHHSATLRKLSVRGLVAKRVRGGQTRGSLLYKITYLGKVAVGAARKS